MLDSRSIVKCKSRIVGCCSSISTPSANVLSSTAVSSATRSVTVVRMEEAKSGQSTTKVDMGTVIPRLSMCRLGLDRKILSTVDFARKRVAQRTRLSPSAFVLSNDPARRSTSSSLLSSQRNERTRHSVSSKSSACISKQGGNLASSIPYSLFRIKLSICLTTPGESLPLYTSSPRTCFNRCGGRSNFQP